MLNDGTQNKKGFGFLVKFLVLYMISSLLPICSGFAAASGEDVLLLELLSYQFPKLNPMIICLRLSVLLFFLQSFGCFAQTEFRRPDVEAEFPGGKAEMYKFLLKNLRFPEKALKANVSGKVFLQLKIDSVGSIVNIKALKGFGSGVEKECIRVVRLMPAWQPARISGKSTSSLYNLPINICLE
ncbi:energy transducer TonB [Dyadobacter sp. CY312]|uniref:energy transducer TonB n=1 Tax=Dyadobacter sp. CY312 TaxID=2907303 RepID=UPI001F4326FC|nr:energy transducer TonB [Dyadobacter sp. CY312]MCE7042772.1 energy transducer TonB [Dyadobacter sp. CY312]